MKKAVQKLKEIANNVYKEIKNRKQPTLHMPVRALSNVFLCAPRNR